MLKGPKGTPVTITVRRDGHAAPMHFSLIRDNVPRGSVNYAFWLRPGIAYMRVEAFNETTSHEVDQALAKFPESSIEGLVLDLRDNPGGLGSGGRQRGRSFPAQGPAHRVASWPRLGRNQVHRQARRARARVSRSSCW